MKKIKENNLNFFKKVFDKHYTGKLITVEKKIDIRKEILNFEFLKKKRSLCLIECYNSPESILSYISILSFGSVPLLINENLNEIFFRRYIVNFLPDYIFTKRKVINKKYILLKTYNDIFFYKSKSSFKKKIHKDLAILLPTSGSTGSSKMVRISYKNLYSNTIDICNYLKIKKIDTTLTTMPFSYTYGMSIINTHLIKGANIFVYPGSVIQKNFFEILKRFKITTFGGVPYIYNLLIKIGLERLKNMSLKYITHAGGALDVNSLLKLYKFCKKNNLKFISMYGASEATSRMSYLPFSYMKKKIGSVGRGLQKSFILKDLDNKLIIKPFVKGELVYRGDNVCLGYANTWKDLALGDENRGILKTGDEGYFDNEGFFYISGRKNRDVKLYGHRVNLDDLEKNLNMKFSNSYVKYMNKKLYIFRNKKIDEIELNNFLFKRFNIKKNMIEFIKIKKIPYTTNKKIDYSKLHVN